MKPSIIPCSLALVFGALPGNLAASGVVVPGPIAAWQAANVPGHLTSILQVAGVSDASISRGPGLIVDTRFPGYFDSHGWNSSVSFPGIASDEYLSIVFVLNQDFTATLTSLRFAFSSGGSVLDPRSIELRSSADGFATTLLQDDSVVPFPGIGLQQVDLSALDPIEGMIEFRIWGYDSPGGVNNDPNAILGLANSPDLFIDGQSMAMILEGSVVPEPSVFATLGMTLLMALSLRRRK